VDEVGKRESGTRASRRSRATTAAAVVTALAAGAFVVLGLLQEYAGVVVPAPVRWFLILVFVVGTVTQLVQQRRERRPRP